MDKPTRNTLRNTVTQCRRLLEAALGQELAGRFGIYATGAIDDAARMGHLSAEEREYREQLLVHLEHIRAGGFKPADAVAQLVREVSFTHLNRLVAYKMMEARGLIREAVSRGPKSQGFLFYLADHPGGRGALVGRAGRSGLPAFPDEPGRDLRRRDPRAFLPDRSGEPPVPAAAHVGRGAGADQRRGAGRHLGRGRDHRVGVPVLHAQGAARPGAQGEPGPAQFLRAGVPQPVLHPALRGRVPVGQHPGAHLVRDAAGQDER